MIVQMWKCCQFPMLPIPIGHWVLAIGNICSLATFPHGVVSDAVPCLFNGVICDLPFKAVGLPMEVWLYVSTPSHVPSIPLALQGRWHPCHIRHLEVRPDRHAPGLVTAHAHLDTLVDKAYGLSPSCTVLGRVAQPFKLYAEKTASSRASRHFLDTETSFYGKKQI